MQQHSVLLKVSNVLDQYIHYKLIPEKGYSYCIHENDIVITYEYTEDPLLTNIPVEVSQQKKKQLLDFLRKAAKALILLDVYSKVTIRQCSHGEELSEDIY